MPNPIASVPNVAPAILLIALIGSAIFMRVLYRLTKCLRPRMVSLEIAGSAKRVDEILRAWGSDGRTDARRSLGVDNLFVVFYSTLIAMLCFWLGDSGWAPGGASVAVGIGWVSWIAGSFDWLENYGALRLLNGARGRWPAITAAAAWTKWALLCIAVVYVAGSGLIALVETIGGHGG